MRGILNLKIAIAFLTISLVILSWQTTVNAQNSEANKAQEPTENSSRRKPASQEETSPTAEKPSHPASEQATQDSNTSANTEPTKQELAAIEFSVEGKEPIFEYSRAKSQVASTNGKKFIPDLQIFPNGRVVLGGRNPSIKQFDSSISKVDLTQLLHLIVNQNRFYEIDMAETKKQMKSKKVKVTLADANTQAFAIKLPKGKKEIQVYALYNATSNFPDIENVQRLARIEKACNDVITKIHLGDDGPAILALVNKACADHEQEIEPFKLEDLRLATRMIRGRFQVSFQRIYPAVGKTPERKLNAIYFRKDENSKPSVMFYGLPKK